MEVRIVKMLFWVMNFIFLHKYKKETPFLPVEIFISKYIQFIVRVKTSLFQHCSYKENVLHQFHFNVKRSSNKEEYMLLVWY